MPTICEMLEQCREPYSEIAYDAGLLDAIRLMSRKGVRLLVVRGNLGIVGLVTGTEIVKGLGAGVTEGAMSSAVGSLAVAPIVIDRKAGCREGLSLLARAASGFLTIMDGDAMVDVISGLQLARRYAALLETELDTLNHYLADLHDALRD
jgi:CBS domain-containing protein